MGSLGRGQSSVIACQAVVSLRMISGAHLGIMTDGEFDFSDKEHEAALQALIKDGKLYSTRMATENFASLKSAKLTRSGSLSTGAIPYPQHCSPANGVRVCA